MGMTKRERLQQVFESYELTSDLLLDLVSILRELEAHEQAEELASAERAFRAIELDTI